jgi:hypothetical protein
MANKDKGGGNNLTRQHHQMATGNMHVGFAKGGAVKSGSFPKGAKVAPKRK